MGLSLLGVMHVDKAIDNQFITYNPYAGMGTYFFQESSIDQINYSLYPKLGIQMMPMPKFSLGLTLAKMLPVGGTKVIKTS